MPRVLIYLKEEREEFMGALVNRLRQRGVQISMGDSISYTSNINRINNEIAEADGMLSMLVIERGGEYSSFLENYARENKVPHIVTSFPYQ